MRGRILVGAIVLIIPAAMLGMFGFLRFTDGVARDSAIPVPGSMIAGERLPKGAYVAAYDALAGADPGDGDAAIVRGEAARFAGLPGRLQINLFEQGLTRSPASVRGWTLLTLSSAEIDPPLAASALGQALLLAPADFWTADMRAVAAAGLWNHLDKDAQAEALAQTRLLWEEPLLRSAFFDLLATAGGRQLITRAFAGNGDELISLNRWISAQKRKAASSR